MRKYREIHVFQYNTGCISLQGLRRGAAERRPQIHRGTAAERCRLQAAAHKGCGSNWYRRGRFTIPLPHVDEQILPPAGKVKAGIRNYIFFALFAMATGPMQEELAAAETLLEQKRQVAADYQEGWRNQSAQNPQVGGTGTATPISTSTTPKGQKDTAPNRLSDILGALGDTPGKPIEQ
jgi:hypothetical protein